MKRVIPNLGFDLTRERVDLADRESVVRGEKSPFYWEVVGARYCDDFFRERWFLTRMVITSVFSPVGDARLWVETPPRHAMRC